MKKSESQSDKRADAFYHSPSWRKLRARILAYEPLCYYCNLSGTKRLATIGDHFRPRKIFPELELEQSNIRPSCDHHHNQKRNFERNITNKEQFDRLIEGFLKGLKK